MKNIISHHSVSACLGLCLALSSSVYAEDDHGHRQHGAHEHGHAVLNIVQENKSIQMMLGSPAVNIVGFEYSPVSDQERDALKHAIDILNQGDQLFHISPDAECKLTKVELDTELSDTDEHEHEHEDGHEKTLEMENHADFNIKYSFTCSDPSKIKKIKVKLFDEFPLMEDIEGQLITDTKQLGFELSPVNSTIMF